MQAKVEKLSWLSRTEKNGLFYSSELQNYILIYYSEKSLLNNLNSCLNCDHFDSYVLSWNHNLAFLKFSSSCIWLHNRLISYFVLIFFIIILFNFVSFFFRYSIPSSNFFFNCRFSALQPLFFRFLSSSLTLNSFNVLYAILLFIF